jgi:tetratricopeptide (TPR) repeat protein
MNKRILIVDDETNVRLNFRTTLETECYEIFEAGSGEAAAGQDGPPAETFSAHIVAAKRCLNLRAFAKARLHLGKALELNVKSAEAFNLAGVLAEVLEDYDKAKKYYGQAIKLNKNYEPAQQNMRRLFEVHHFGSSKEPVNLGDK